MTQPPPKRPRTGFFNALQEFIEEGPPISSNTDSTNELDAAIDAYRKMPALPQEADPLVFWRDNSASSLLRQGWRASVNQRLTALARLESGGSADDKFQFPAR